MSKRADRYTDGPNMERIKEASASLWLCMENFCADVALFKTEYEAGIAGLKQQLEEAETEHTRMQKRIEELEVAYLQAHFQC